MGWVAIAVLASLAVLAFGLALFYLTSLTTVCPTPITCFGEPSYTLAGLAAVVGGFCLYFAYRYRR